MKYIGIDEVGVGCLAGPVLVCGLVPKPLFPPVGDSKSYTPKKRAELFWDILNCCEDMSVAWADNLAVDTDGIWGTWETLVRRVARELRSRNGDLDVRLDGNKVPAGLVGAAAIVGGDAVDQVIGGASIVAKVIRDELIEQLHPFYPEYDFKSNKGYTSPKHIEALKAFGPCPLHRHTFIRKILGTM